MQYEYSINSRPLNEGEVTSYQTISIRFGRPFVNQYIEWESKESPYQSQYCFVNDQFFYVTRVHFRVRFYGI